MPGAGSEVIIYQWEHPPEHTQVWKQVSAFKIKNFNSKVHWRAESKK
jgi:hypothetical protein